MFTEALKKSGLTQTELAALFGVSRITVNSWLCGRFNPHPLHRDRIEDVSKKIEQAVYEFKLPLPEGTPKSQRIQAAQTAIHAA